MQLGIEFWNCKWFSVLPMLEYFAPTVHHCGSSLLQWWDMVFSTSFFMCVCISYMKQANWVAKCSTAWCGPTNAIVLRNLSDTNEAVSRECSFGVVRIKMHVAYFISRGNNQKQGKEPCTQHKVLSMLPPLYSTWINFKFSPDKNTSRTRNAQCIIFQNSTKHITTVTTEKGILVSWDTSGNLEHRKRREWEEQCECSGDIVRGSHERSKAHG